MRVQVQIRRWVGGTMCCHTSHCPDWYINIYSYFNKDIWCLLQNEKNVWKSCWCMGSGTTDIRVVKGWCWGLWIPVGTERLEPVFNIFDKRERDRERWWWCMGRDHHHHHQWRVSSQHLQSDTFIVILRSYSYLIFIHNILDNDLLL